jgi:MOSC domain-containing protein YiiM
MSAPVLRAIFLADGPDFVTSPILFARLSFGGIAGDRHAGLTRKSCARTPWHTRGTKIANTRQLSILSVEECREIAALLAVEKIDPRLLGGNFLTEGIPALSALPPGTRLKFPSGATVFITEENHPCHQPARKIAEAFDAPNLRAGFSRAATGRRGLVALVEREGDVAAGDAIEILSVPARRPPIPVTVGERV